MAGLQRFITYINKYENDEKRDNAGFAKIEIRGSMCRVEVHIRNISIEQSEATVYLFARESEIMQGIPVGSMEIVRGGSDVRYAFDTKEIKSFGMSMGDIQGIFIPLDENGFLASQWKEGNISGKNFRIQKKQERKEVADEGANPSQTDLADSSDRQASPQGNSEGYSQRPQGRGALRMGLQRANTGMPPKHSQAQAAFPEGTQRLDTAIPGNSPQQQAALSEGEQRLDTAMPGSSPQQQAALSEGVHRLDTAMPGSSPQQQAALSKGEQRLDTAMPGSSPQQQAVLSEGEQRLDTAMPGNHPQGYGASSETMQRSDTVLPGSNPQGQSVPETDGRQISPETPLQDFQASMQNNSAKQNDAAVSQGNAPDIPQVQSQEKRSIRATELPLENFREETGWGRIFGKLRLKSGVCFPFEGQEIECVRMNLNDLREFPQKYWYLGKNSFLLHGFFNYRHILLGETEERGKKEYFLGIPGVFQNQERLMASMFGFPGFRTAKAAEYKTGSFGYWYRII